jgi:hypothetical protein
LLTWLPVSPQRLCNTLLLQWIVQRVRQGYALFQAIRVHFEGPNPDPLQPEAETGGTGFQWLGHMTKKGFTQEGDGCKKKKVSGGCLTLRLLG